MKILVINSECGTRSTGKISVAIAEQYEKEGYEAKVAYGRRAFVPEQYKKFAVRIGTDTEVKIHALLTRITDKHGLYSKHATKEFLQWAEEYNPDILWLHNIHSYYINYEMLFEWIKSRPQMEVKWTLHDCWSFTGHCVHFSVVKCDRWKTKCRNCSQTREFPGSYVLSNCTDNYNRKKQAFTGVKNMTIITPSNWLASLVKQSFLKEYPVEVVYNTIDTDIFKPTPSDFRERNNLENRKIVLGVASDWSERKGLNDFIKLSEQLSDEYKIVLVGLDEKQLKRIPGSILGIKRTHGQKELAEIYTAADVFVNPSKEETFGLTTLEALSCGTQAIVYKDTACEEVVNKYGGIAVEQEFSVLYDSIVKATHMHN